MDKNTASKYWDSLLKLEEEVDKTILFFVSGLKRADLWWEEDDMESLGVEEFSDEDKLGELPGAAHISKHSYYDWLNIIRVSFVDGNVIYTGKSTGENDLDLLEFDSTEVELRQKIDILQLLQSGEFAQAKRKAQ